LATRQEHRRLSHKPYLARFIKNDGSAQAAHSRKTGSNLTDVAQDGDQRSL
jgi:hypothetical protein